MITIWRLLFDTLRIFFECDFAVLVVMNAFVLASIAFAVRLVRLR